MEPTQEPQVIDNERCKVMEVPMSSIVTIGITGIITIGGLALFLKNKKPVMKWGGLFIFGIGLLSLCLGFYLTPPS